ncbi:hypothetical protein FEM03_20895 [Phragmitibacter flavus]|uniref:Uncharacterized protein n=1 Tax=Phragmitibacter flavus TaxID=2576071 RepID=A0A5R8K900_9BACT|nr:hypothetical protein [Phragmitibacter flavus]TLD68793.1 hypothetical protein FEM03_20895 [Phragmitibacter flavus]
MPPEKILQISKAHGFLNKCILAYIIIYILCLGFKDSESILSLVLLITLVAVILLSAVATVRLSSKINHPAVTVIYALLVLIPVVGGLILLLTSNSAHKILRKEGYKIGFFGSIKQ